MDNKSIAPSIKAIYHIMLGHMNDDFLTGSHRINYSIGAWKANKGIGEYITEVLNDRSKN